MPFKLAGLLTNKKDHESTESTSTLSSSAASSTYASASPDPSGPTPDSTSRRSSIASIASSIRSVAGQVGVGGGGSKGDNGKGAPLIFVGPNAVSRRSSGSHSPTAAGEYRQQVLAADEKERARLSPSAPSSPRSRVPPTQNARPPRSPALSLNTSQADPSNSADPLRRSADYDDLQTPLATGRSGMSFPIPAGLGSVGAVGAGSNVVSTSHDGLPRKGSAGGLPSLGVRSQERTLNQTGGMTKSVSTPGLGGQLPMTAPPAVSNFPGSAAISPITVGPPHSPGSAGLTVPAQENGWDSAASRRLSNASVRPGSIGITVAPPQSAPIVTGPSSSSLHPSSASGVKGTGGGGGGTFGIAGAPLTTVSSNRSDHSQSPSYQQHGHPTNPLDLLATAKDKVKEKVAAKKRSRRGSSSATNRQSYVEDEDGNIVPAGGTGSKANGSTSSRRNSRVRAGSDGSALGPASASTALDRTRSRGLSVNSSSSPAGHALLSETDETDSEDDEDESMMGDGIEMAYGNDGERSSVVSSRGDSLAVTGFAVASNRRNVEFHGMFPEVDEGDYLIEDYGCALQKDILHQGRIYVSENHICFHANIFGWVTNVVLPFSNVVAIEKKMTAFVIPNAIAIVSRNGKVHTFASFISRDTTYDVFINVWRHSKLDAESHASSEASIDESYPVGGSADAGAVTANGTKPSGGSTSRKATTCDCGKAGEHFPESMLDAIFPTSPDKAYDLLFKSAFLKDFMLNDQKLTNVTQTDWTSGPVPHRDMSYVKPLSGSIGPKQTRCDLTDDLQHMDPDHYISITTVTKTPEVPSGNVFSVVTKSCFTWAGPTSCRVQVTTKIEWTGRSFIKGIIDRSAIDGQRSWHVALEKAARTYLKDHMDEYRVHGPHGEIVEEEADIAEIAPVQDATITPSRSPLDATAGPGKQTPARGHGALATITRSIGDAILAVFDSLGDALRSIPLSKETALVVLILVLAMSNLWTYSSLKRERVADPEERRARRLSRAGLAGTAPAPEKEVVRVIQAYLSHKPVMATAVASQVGELQDILLAIESRAKILQEHLAQDERRILQNLDTLE